MIRAAIRPVSATRRPPAMIEITTASERGAGDGQHDGHVAGDDPLVDHDRAQQRPRLDRERLDHDEGERRR